MPPYRIPRIPTAERRSMLVVERGDKYVSLDSRLDTIEAQVSLVNRKVDRGLWAFLILGIIVNAPTGVKSLADLLPSLLRILGLQS